MWDNLEYSIYSINWTHYIFIRYRRAFREVTPPRKSIRKLMSDNPFRNKISPRSFYYRNPVLALCLLAQLLVVTYIRILGWLLLKLRWKYRLWQLKRRNWGNYTSRHHHHHHHHHRRRRCRRQTNNTTTIISNTIFTKSNINSNVRSRLVKVIDYISKEIERNIFALRSKIVA
jgi:hypothetical protein